MPSALEYFQFALIITFPLSRLNTWGIYLAAGWGCPSREHSHKRSLEDDERWTTNHGNGFDQGRTGKSTVDGMLTDGKITPIRLRGKLVWSHLPNVLPELRDKAQT